MSNLFTSTALSTLALSVAVAGNALAAGYPERPVTIIVSFAAGGATDIATRILGKYLTQSLGQQIVVDNRGGAGGLIAIGAAARAKPDGYTLLVDVERLRRQSEPV